MNAHRHITPNSLRSVYIEPIESPVDYHRDALEYWQEKRGDRFAPSWSDISLMDFPAKVIPAIIVLDINADRSEMSYRFWGTQLTELFGRDYTGCSPNELQPRLVAETSINAYEKMAKEKKPHLEVKEFFRDNRLRGRQIVLRMPLSNDGIHLTNSLNITYQDLARATRPHSEFFEYVLFSE